MELQDWKKKFAPAILERGENYFHNGAVHMLEWEDEQIDAVVSGERDYNVHISVINGVVSHMLCDCPFAREGNYCKHMAAVLFAAFDDGCYEVEKYISTRKRFMDNVIPDLLAYGRPDDGLDLACKVFADASEVGLEYWDRSFTSLYEDCEKHWRAIWPHLSQSQRSIMFEWLLAHYSRWDASKTTIESFLFGNSFQEPAFLEPEFLRRELELLDTEIQNSGTWEADLNRLVKLRFDTMKRIPVEQAEIARYTEQYYRVRSIREQLIKDALRECRVKDAIMVLRDSKTIDGENSPHCRKYSEKLMELYQTLGLVDELKSELLYYLERFPQSDFRYVNMLKGITPPQDWPEMSERVLNLHIAPNARDDLLRKNKQYKRLLEYVIASGDACLMDKHFDILSELYPNEVRTFYVACIKTGMAKARKRSHYATQARRLKRLSQIQGGEKVAAALAEEWRTTWPRRPAMLEALQKYGF